MLKKGTFLLAALFIVGINESSADLIFAGTGTTLTRSDNDGADKKVFVTGLSEGDNKGVFYDLTTKTVYFADGRTIKSSDRSGGNRKTVITATSVLYDVVIDQVNNKVIWTDFEADLVRRANFDGSAPETLVVGNGPASLAIDAVKGKIYWTEIVSGSVRRANLDGSTPETIATNQGNPSGIVVDVVNERVYWTSASQNLIRRANLDGSAQTNIVAGLNSPPRGLSLGQGRLFWVSDSGAVLQALIDGSGQTSLGTVANATDVEFTLDVIAPTPTPTATSTATLTPVPGTPTPTPTGTLTISPTVTGSPTVAGPTGTTTPGATPTSGTPVTPGPSPTPTPLPRELVKASQIFGFVFNSSTPVESVVINGGDLGLALTDEGGKFEFFKATPGTTYTFKPERTGLTFDPLTFDVPAQIGATVPLFMVTAVATPGTGCVGVDISHDIATIASNARDIRNRIVSELTRLGRQERSNRRLKRSADARAKLLTDTRATFLALTAGSIDIPEIVYDCGTSTQCPSTSFAAAVDGDRALIKTLRNYAKRTVTFIKQAGDATRATRVGATLTRKGRTAAILLTELPKDSDVCS